MRVCCRASGPNSQLLCLRARANCPSCLSRLCREGLQDPLILLPCPCSQIEGLALARTRSPGFRENCVVTEMLPVLLILELASLYMYQPVGCSFMTSSTVMIRSHGKG